MEALKITPNENKKFSTEQTVHSFSVSLFKFTNRGQGLSLSLIKITLN